MASVISHALSLVLYYLAGILSVDDLCVFKYLILQVPILICKSPGLAKKKCALPPSRFLSRGGRAFGGVVARNAYSSDNFMSRQLYKMKLSYEIGSHCMGRCD